MRFAWDDEVRVIGHRGAPREATENTLASFLAAAASGADAVELDVHLSKDREVVVHHDAHLGRVVAGEGAVGDRTADQLAALGIPRLRDVLDAYAGLVDVELKPDGRDVEALPEAVADVVAAAGALDRVLATSFDPFLADAYAARAERPAGFVTFFGVTPEDLAELPRLRHVLLAREACAPDVVSALRQDGRVVSAWTVNELEEATRLVAMGVRGIITDRPAELAALPRGRGDAAP